MIDILFYQGTEIVFVRVDGATLKFSTSLQNNIWAPIDGLKLDYAGVIKEFPELEGESHWRDEAIFRLKCKLKDFKTEEERSKYVIEDLKKFGYIPVKKMEHGHRWEKLE